MYKLLPIYKQTYSTVSWGSLAAIEDVLELSHLRRFSLISQKFS
jgi:hypothetical protein